MTATVTATGGYIDLSAVQIDFSGIVLGSSSTASLVVTNDGAGTLTFTGFAYQSAYGALYQIVSSSRSSLVIGGAFLGTGFPDNGATLAAGVNVTISLTFMPTVTGTSASILTFWFNGGWQEVMLVGNCISLHSRMLYSLQLKSAVFIHVEALIFVLNNCIKLAIVFIYVCRIIQFITYVKLNSLFNHKLTAILISIYGSVQFSISAITTSPSVSPTLAIKPRIDKFTVQGCYTEATGQRALNAVS